MQVKKAIAEYASFAPPPEAVTSLIAKEEEWVPSLRAVGSTAAVQGVTVSTDEPGIVQKIAFESGQTVKEGDLLVQLEVSQEQAQLRSAEAQMRLAQSEPPASAELAQESREFAGGLRQCPSAVRSSRGEG